MFIRLSPERCLLPPSSNEGPDTVSGALGAGVVQSGATFLIPMVDCPLVYIQNCLQRDPHKMGLYIHNEMCSIP